MSPLWARWCERPMPDAHRCVLLDVETSGLHPRCDDLLCVSAMALHRRGRQWSMVAADSFDALIRPLVVCARPDNVLLHRIGRGMQEQGVEPSKVLQDLKEWIARSPVMAFHAGFDRAFVMQAFRRARMQRPSWLWLDLADILPQAFPQSKARSLDEWLAYTRIECLHRHQAAADVWATAQLWMMAMEKLHGSPSMGWTQWERLARRGRWLRTLQSLQ
jgi:DNA polymerase-3 subunit epsilon